MCYSGHMKILDDESVPELKRYPWHEWCDGKSRLAEREIDYIVTDKAFAAGLRVRAARTGLRVRSYIGTDGVLFRFYKD